MYSDLLPGTVLSAGETGRKAPDGRPVETRLRLQRLSWKQTFARLRADHSRLIGLLDEQDQSRATAFFHPSFACVFLYRISNHFVRSGHRYVARLFWHLNMLLTGADIAAPAELGEGLVVMSPSGIAIAGVADRNLTVMPCSGLGGEVGRREDVGAGPGLPVLGTDVILEPHCGVLGPVRIGNRVRVCAGVVVTRDVADDTVVQGLPARFRLRRDLP